MTTGAKRHVVGLVLHQQIGLCRCMRLVASQAVNGHPDFGDIVRLHLVYNRVVIHRVAAAVLERQPGNSPEIGLRQPYIAAENRYQLRAFHRRRPGIGPVALEAKPIGSARPQQVSIFAAVRLMARGATLLEGGLMEHLFLVLFRLVGVAAEADVHGVRLRKTWGFAGVRIVTVGAIARCTGVLYLGLLDLLRFFGVAVETDLFRSGCGQHHLAIFGRLMTGIALLLSKGHVRELLHQLGTVRLVRIVASEAIGAAERLSLMGLDQGFILNVVTVEAERRRIFGQVILEFALVGIAGLVSDVTSIAPHVERGMAAALLRYIQALGMAGEAEILVLASG